MRADQSFDATQDKQIMVTLRKRDKQVFKGSAWAVSSINEVGKFDVLWGHANMVTTIKDEIVIRFRKGYMKTHKIDSGILSAESNEVEVFLGV